MESFLIKAAQLIAALALLVVIHEFGHYFFARVFGIRVEKFYLFFNPWFSLFKWKPKPPRQRRTRPDGTPKPSWRDTEYGIGWIPLGGYCKIAGMIDESMDKEQMAQPAKPDEFRSRPAYQRLAVMVGGVFFNFILAIIIYIGIALHWGSARIPMDNVTEGMNFSPEALAAGYQNGDVILLADGRRVYDDEMYDIADADSVTVMRNGVQWVIANPQGFVTSLKNGLFDKDMPFRMPVCVQQTNPNSPASEAGLKEDDRIIAVGSVMTPTFPDFTAQLSEAGSSPTTITYVRGNDTITAPVTPDGGKLGFMLKPLDKIYDVDIRTYNVFQAVPYGIVYGSKQLKTYVSSLKHLFSKEGAKQVGGFGAIGNMFPDRWNWRNFWELTAFLSIILAFMNILPIPALDGGHVMFVLWEMVTGRKPSDKFLEYAQVGGMLFLLALLLYANGNDLFRFVFK